MKNPLHYILNNILPNQLEIPGLKSSNSSSPGETPDETDENFNDGDGVTDSLMPSDGEPPEATSILDSDSPYKHGRENPAHHSHYTYDQSDTDVQLRREPGLQRHFPFELTATASGDGRAQPGDVFAGFDVRDRLIDSHTYHPDEPIWLGYDTNPMDGIHEIGLEPFSWFRHMTIFGSTGKGKSTTLNIMMNQIARKGYGFVFIDPKGDTVDDLITQLPDERMDDIVWIEPGSETYDQVAGINFLEPGECETEIEFDREVESIINDLRAVLRGGEYWGPKMEGITSNIARAMIRSRRKFTLVDMYYVLIDDESRAKFANVVSQEGMSFIHEYTTKIAEMDDEEIDPVLRRIQDWVEDPISRGIVAHRDGTINLSHAVEEGKIILVRNTVRSDEIRKVVSTGIMRRVWSTIRKREKVEEADREPFFAIMDEFDDIASENMALDTMLSKARSGKMGVITCLQNPSQLRDIAPQTLKQMFGNTDTLLSFGVTEVDDARIIAERFDDDSIDSGTVMSLPAYTALTTISVMDEDGPMRSDPLAPDTFAPYPARRTRTEAEAIIGENLNEYGVDPLEQSLDNSEHVLMHLGGENDLTKCFLEAVWSKQIRENALNALPGEYDTLEPAPALNINPPQMQDDETLTVTVKQVNEGFRRRTSTGFEELPTGLVIDTDFVELLGAEPEQSTESVRRSGGLPAGKVLIDELDTELSITDKGIRSVLEQAEDDWRNQTEKHNEVLRRAFVVLSAIGMEVSIVRQENKQELPDAIAYPPIQTTVDTKRASRLFEQFKKNYPIAADLSDGGVIAIEAETSTYKKPAHTLQNLARAVRHEQRAIFFTPSSESTKSAEPAARVNHVLTDPMFIRGHLSTRPDEDSADVGNDTERDPMPLYYNKTSFLDLGTATDGQRKHALIKKGKQAVWVNTDDNQITLYNEMTDGVNKGTLRMEDGFGSTNAFDVWCRYDEHNNEWVVYLGGERQRYQTLSDLREDWQLVYEPFVPEREFEEIPGEDQWDIIQTPLPEFLSPAGDTDDEETDTAGDEEPPEGDVETEDTDTEPVPGGTYTSIEEVPQETTLGQQNSDSDDDDSDIDLDRAGFTREAVPIPERLITGKMPSRDSDVSGVGSKPGSNTTHEAPPEAFNSMVPEKYMSIYRAIAALATGGNTRDSADSYNDESASGGDTPATDEDDSLSEETANADNDSSDGIHNNTDDRLTPISRLTFSPAAAKNNLHSHYIVNTEIIDENESQDSIEFDDDVIDKRFGAKDPTTTEFWQDVWDFGSNNPAGIIQRDDLYSVLTRGPSIRGRKAAAAIRIGLVTNKLVPVGEDALRLPGPCDSYQDHLSEDEVIEMQHRDSWAPVWDTLGHGYDEKINVAMAIIALKFDCGFEESVAQAAIGAGVEAGVIKEDGTKISLSERTLPTFWKAVLTGLSADPHEPLTRSEVAVALEVVHELGEEQIDDTIEVARNHGVVYRDDTTGQIKVNTPCDNTGPDIDEDAFNRGTYPAGDHGSDGDNRTEEPDKGDMAIGNSDDPSEQSALEQTDADDEPSDEGEMSVTDEIQDSSPADADATSNETNIDSTNAASEDAPNTTESPSGADTATEGATVETHRVGQTVDDDIEDASFDKVYRRYGQVQSGEHFPEPLGQFLNRYTNTENDKITTDTDETMFVPKADLRDAYNAWVQIYLRHVHSNSNGGVDETDLKELPTGTFTVPMKSKLGVQLKEGRPMLEDGSRSRVWYGIELTDEGENLVELEGKFISDGD